MSEKKKKKSEHEEEDLEIVNSAIKSLTRLNPQISLTISKDGCDSTSIKLHPDQMKQIIQLLDLKQIDRISEFMKKSSQGGVKTL